jgi:hypothetical protein
MMPARFAALVLLLAPACAMAKDKKPAVPAILGTATYVYVEAQDGDLMQPGLYPPDRQAIGDVEDALREWKRYKVTTLKDKAEIVVVVRKGRVANGQVEGQVAQPLPPGRGPVSTGTDARAEFGQEEDMLRVYMQDANGKRVGPVWDRSMTDGLDAPQLLLFRQLKDAVEKAYPQTAASQTGKP